MTNKEREFATLGMDHVTGDVEHTQSVVVLPTGRETRKENGGWIAQPPNDNYWKWFPCLLDACKYALGK